MAGRKKEFQNNFNGGEISPLLNGRWDLEAYKNGCSELTNFIPLPQGGAVTRWGTRYVCTVKDSTKKVRVVNFEFSTTQAYCLEFGEHYIRVIKDGAQVLSAPATPVEITTTYDEDELDDLDVRTQSADTLYIMHPDHPPAKLTRSSHTVWALSDIVFNPPPSYEADTDLAQTLTPAATTGTNIQFDSGGACFLAADKDREIKYGTARAIITVVDSSTRVHADIRVDFPDTDPIASGSWFLTGSPVTAITPSKSTPVGAACTLTLAAFGFRAADVGKYVHVHGGTILITSLVTASWVNGKILSVLTDVTATSDWTMESAAWTATLGYPRTCCFYEDRLCFAGAANKPSTIYGSKTADYESLAAGTMDDDAFEFNLSAQKVNVIKWLISGPVLLAGTNGEEFPIRKSSDSPMSSVNPPDMKATTGFGSSDVWPINVNGNLYFVQKSGRQLIEYGFSWEQDRWDGRDCSLRSEHLTTGGIAGITYQQSPYSIIWLWMEDGRFCSITTYREEKIFGWAEHWTSGNIESMVTVPDATNNRDTVYIAVKRWINGAVVRTIEYLDPDMNVDCGLIYDGVSATTFSGLDHLIGATVELVGNDAVFPHQVVSASGTVIFSTAITTAQVGLAISPNPKLIPMRPGPPGSLKKWSDIYVRLYETQGLNINGDIIPFARAGMTLAVTPFSDDKHVSNLGWDRDGYVTMEQTQPLPATILALYGQLLVGD